MGKYDHLEVQGAERAQILAEIEAQVREWGLALPPVEPLLLHFGLGRVREIGDCEYWIANEEALGYCGKFLFMLDGQTCPRHYHRLKHETFFLVRGELLMRRGEEEFLLRPGEVLPMPPGTKHAFTGRGNALVLEVSQPSVLQDNFFDDPALGDHGVI